MAAVTTGASVDTTGLVNLECLITAVGASAPQVAGSTSPLDEFATPAYSQVRQELFVAEETTQNSVKIPTDHELMIGQKSSEILKRLDKMIDSLSTVKDLGVQMENIELLTDQVAKRAMTMMSTLLDPREAVPWKRRKIIPMPRIMEDSAGLVSAAGSLVDSVRDGYIPRPFHGCHFKSSTRH